MTLEANQATRINKSLRKKVLAPEGYSWGVVEKNSLGANG